MLQNLSCTAGAEELENIFSVQIKHPHLYSPCDIINGTEESNVLAITRDERHTLQPALWGLLPENYGRQWNTFQKDAPSLFYEERNISEDLWWADSLVDRRCLIPVTGFYTSYVSRGDCYTYHLGLPGQVPFYLAGICNRTDDGFLTVALLLTTRSECIKPFMNSSTQIPVIVEDVCVDNWLNRNDYGLGIYQHENLVAKLVANSIPTDLFANGITYASMFESSSDEQAQPKWNSFFFKS